MNATMANIPLVAGYAPNQSKKGLNIMLQKQAGNISVEKAIDNCSIWSQLQHEQ